MKSILQKIDLRFIIRLIAIALLGMQIGILIIFLAANQMKEASTAFALAAWMILALLFETKAHNLQKEKKNLEEFLSNPGSKGEMD